MIGRNLISTTAIVAS